MITPELIQYIISQRAKGTSDEIIRKTLLDNGWKSVDINEGFVKIIAQQKAAANIKDRTSIADASPVVLKNKNKSGHGVRNVLLGLLLLIILAVIGIIYADTKGYITLPFDIPTLDGVMKDESVEAPVDQATSQQEQSNQPAATLSFVSPQAGDVWTLGETHEVAWNVPFAFDTSCAEAVFLYSIDTEQYMGIVGEKTLAQGQTMLAWKTDTSILGHCGEDPLSYPIPPGYYELRMGPLPHRAISGIFELQPPAQTDM